MSKSKRVESIEKLKVGSEDSSGNKVKNILATSNEFAIYEIEHKDINSKLRVLIDGESDESEKDYTKKFNVVKQKYIEAKGLLAKAANYENMKHRIAHTLSTCLSSDDIDGNKEFDQLINQINTEHEKIVLNRFLYLMPSLFSVILLFLIVVFIAAGIHLDGKPISLYWHLFTLLLSASIGGGLSILITAKNLNFEEFTSDKHYLILGLERLVLAFMAGGATYILIKSQLAFPQLSQTNHWAIMAIVLLSGFSESFIPSILGKLNPKNA